MAKCDITRKIKNKYNIKIYIFLFHRRKSRYSYVFQNYFQHWFDWNNFFPQTIFIRRILFSIYLILRLTRESCSRRRIICCKIKINSIKNQIYRNFNDESAILTNATRNLVVDVALWKYAIESSCIATLVSFAFWKLALCSAMKFNSTDIALCHLSA